jgi:kumamolisin
VWNDTAAGDGAGGGGVSDEFDLPTWQQPAVSSGGNPAPAPTGTNPGPNPGPDPGEPYPTGPGHHRRHRRRRHRIAEQALTGPGRCVPDCAGNADPATGYIVVSDGRQIVVGGTSAWAPMMAALTARLTAIKGRRLGPLGPVIYQGAQPGQTAPGWRDITSGDNGTYRAGPGFDCCTGLGSPDGAALEAALP